MKENCVTPVSELKEGDWLDLSLDEPFMTWAVGRGLPYVVDDYAEVDMVWPHTIETSTIQDVQPTETVLGWYVSFKDFPVDQFYWGDPSHHVAVYVGPRDIWRFKADRERKD